MQAKDSFNIEAISRLLKEALLKLMPAQGRYCTAIDSVRIARKDELNSIKSCFYEPIIILIAQGSKQGVIGSDNYTYGENQCVVAGIDLPYSGFIEYASPENPCLAVSVSIDRVLLAGLAAELPAPAVVESSRSMAVMDADFYLLDAFYRLVDILDKPEQISVLAPMLIREIHFRLLLGPMGEELKRLNLCGSYSSQIATAVSLIKDHYNQNILMDDLAKQMNMSASSFHRHFRQVTTLSPLQYQKKLRLYEARRLMLTESSDVTGAAYTVGYTSVAQFSREYKRLFGEPPHKDIKKILAR